ncbi:hypothetical protein L6452_08369 [Arctium lappa]|uniref:Uncharacterized protein n=1 Tax=Arctium lappa TaxID=4217 RepID=A0ACB9DHK2_ARCLA|nr:hypothetical protein L6452_08369 [Arctium lappa]
MECCNQMGQLVIPVFYHVDPSDVRRQKGDFETAFRQHEEKSWDAVNEWREAMTAVGKLSGHHISKTVKEGESAFITKIVRDILGHLQTGGMEDNLIGIKSRIKELESLLDLEAIQEVRMVGIWGMGGIGKTTIARALFRIISNKFDGSSFVRGVREESKKDMCALQKRILKDVTHHHESMIEDPEDGAEMIQARFCRKKVLLVLDDVDDEKQLEFLAKTHKWFGKGSRIIITTRDRHLLSYTDDIYKPTLLLEEEAAELFSRYAFRRSSPREGYKGLLNRAIQHTGCLPLAVKVLGSFFYRREVCEWESALNRLAKEPNNKILEKLKISFDGLGDSEQKIFLDIACFFKGQNLKRVTTLLDSFGFDPTIGIRVLTEKSLITVSNEQINMHCVLRDMGLEIVQKRYPNSRLWQCDKIHDILTSKRKLHAIEAIVSMSDKNSGFGVDVFENMKNIRLLDICRDFTSSEPTTLPDGLRWLSWANYPFFSLPVAKLNKLVGLEITKGRIKHLQTEQKIGGGS